MESRVGIVATVKEPIGTLVEFINYHLNLGIAHIELFLDDPTDIAPDLIKNPKITFNRCDKQYLESIPSLTQPGHELFELGNSVIGKAYIDKVIRTPNNSFNAKQVINASLGLARARKRNLDWIAHIDGDELLHTGSLSIGRFFDKRNVAPNTDCVVFRTLEAVAETSKYSSVFQEVSLFRLEPHLLGRIRRETGPSNFAQSTSIRDRVADRLIKSYCDLARLVSPGAFYYQEYLRAHTVGKAAVRTSSKAVGLDLHRPIMSSPESKYKRQILGELLHYDSVSFESWHEKMLRRVNGTMSGIMVVMKRAEQQKQFAANLDNLEELVKLHKNLYTISPSEKTLLLTLGLLKRVIIAPNQFSSPILLPKN